MRSPSVVLLVSTGLFLMPWLSSGSPVPGNIPEEVQSGYQGDTHGGIDDGIYEDYVPGIDVPGIPSDLPGASNLPEQEHSPLEKRMRSHKGESKWSDKGKTVSPAKVPAQAFGHNPAGAASNANSNIKAQQALSEKKKKDAEERAKAYMKDPKTPKGTGKGVDKGTFAPEKAKKSPWDP